MWFDEAVIYQIYPLGLCGAPLVNNSGECEEEAGNHRILRILDWIDHIQWERHAYYLIHYLRVMHMVMIQGIIIKWTGVLEQMKILRKSAMRFMHQA